MQQSLVLYVDDDGMHLKHFSLCMGKYFEVVAVESGSQGLEVLRDQKVSAIVTDQQMKKMSGIEFLKECQKIAPDVPKIMLTAYSNEELLMKAINEGRIQGFFSKPIEERELEFKRSIEREILLSRQAKIIQQCNEELRGTLIELKTSQEKEVALARLDSRHRIVNELGHKVNNPFSAVYGFYQVIEERLANYQQSAEKVKWNEKDLKELLEGLVEIWKEHMGPQIKRVYDLLHRLDRFVRDETDSDGDGIIPRRMR